MSYPTDRCCCCSIAKGVSWVRHARPPRLTGKQRIKQLQSELDALKSPAPIASPWGVRVLEPPTSVNCPPTAHHACTHQCCLHPSVLPAPTMPAPTNCPTTCPTSVACTIQFATSVACTYHYRRLCCGLCVAHSLSHCRIECAIQYISHACAPDCIG